MRFGHDGSNSVLAHCVGDRSYQRRARDRAPLCADSHGGNTVFTRLATFLFVASVAAAQTISTYAGGGTNSSDGIAATGALLQIAGGLAFDRAGNLYIWETGPAKIRKVSPSGTITTFAGNGTSGFSGDGGPATSASLFAGSAVPGLAVDSAGNVYISDSNNQRIRKVNPQGIITTVAGNGTG